MHVPGVELICSCFFRADLAGPEPGREEPAAVEQLPLPGQVPSAAQQEGQHRAQAVLGQESIQQIQIQLLQKFSLLVAAGAYNTLTGPRSRKDAEKLC